MFADQLQKKIDNYQMGCPAKNLLKVILGEIQQVTELGKEISDKQCHTKVKNMIKANESNIKLLSDDDPRKQQFTEENVLLNSLLPQYWSDQDIRNWIKDEDIDVQASNEGAVIGQCMGMLKGEPVEGGMVKKIIHEMRENG